ncbi:restriction endonuclease subunit S [Aliarcobacter butzleri]|uniref:restriction endonuclease subunit S n=1 Tax=Aliarcobacter butzleri TaxID=28197 RepID=UPI0021B26D6A|nr:restriction endonuclease subunit S [Aliarcobacter butzleri]MCT7552316.1 restriction endonuclease subunit S [Aliarcobacter butzleri]
MSSEFMIKKLQDVIEFVIDNRGRNPKSYQTNGIPVIDNYLITNEGKVNLDNVKRFIDEETYNTFLRKYIEKDDVLMTLVGNGYGQVAITPNEQCAIIQNTIGLRCNNLNFNKFLYYLLSNNRESLMNLNRGAAQPSIKVGDILELEFNFPPLPTQKKIAHILSTLDDKIELNRKMNQTLESVASAIFKSWFVDFDPVHAKANCESEVELENIAKELGISKEILDLFPSEFEESELGMIPKGWEVYKIIDKLEVLLGGTPSRSNESYWTNGTVAWINSGKVNEFRIIEASELITEEAVKKSSTKLLPKKTTVLAITGATLGQVSLLEINSCANQSVIGLPQTEELNHSFVYPCICNAIKDLISHQTGGAQQHINKGNVENYQIVIPSSEILKKYVSLAKPLLEQISNLCFENKALEKTRDTLLPKLLSGEIDVLELEIK